MKTPWKTAAELLELVCGNPKFYETVTLQDLGDILICRGCKQSSLIGQEFRHLSGCSVARLLTQCLIAGRDRFLADMPSSFQSLVLSARKVAIEELRDAGVDC